mgnify:CR=1 FL=1
MIPYLTGLEEINHSLLNDLYSDFDAKMVKMLSSGASFILAVGDGADSVGNWDIFPMNAILGQSFFFFTGNPAVIDNIVGYEAVSYNHSPFISAANAVTIDYIDVTGQVAYVKNIYDEFGSTYYDLISKTYTDIYALPIDNTLSFFDYSLEAHNISGYYLAEAHGFTNFGSGSYHPPERHLEYGLADVFTESIGSLTWETEWNKYKCLRFHNFNSTGSLSLTFNETSQNFNLRPFECQSFRNYNGTWEKSPFHYFQEYRSGDPVSYSYWPKNNNGKPWGKSRDECYTSSRNSQSANNLLNSSILLNYVDLLSYKNGAVTELEREAGYYPPQLNAFFHYMYEEDGVDITNLYCINTPSSFEGNFSSGIAATGNQIIDITSSDYYGYDTPLPFPSGAYNIDLILRFPSVTQAVTFDIAPVGDYGPNLITTYASYEPTGNSWIKLNTDIGLTGWVGGQRKNFYMPVNRPFRSYKFKLNGFENSHTGFGLQGLELHGLFDSPKDNDSIIGNLFFHRGQVVKAKVSKTETCFDGRTPSVSFEKIVFNGLDKISDWTNDYQIGVTEVNGQLLLNNLDTGVYVDLYPISTNLFKNAYGYSVVSGFSALSLDNGILIDNKVFEINSFPVSEFYTTYPGKANHLRDVALSSFNSAVPPVLFGNLILNETVTSGTSIIEKGVDTATWPAWLPGSGYQARVSQNGQRYTQDSPYEITGSPRDGYWGPHVQIYAEPFDGANDYRTGDFYSASGAVWVYGDDATPYNGCYYPTGYAGIIEYPESRLGVDYYLETIYQTGASISVNWGEAYTGLIKLHSDTVSLLKQPVLYGYTGGVNQVGPLSFKYEPEGLTFTCNESLNLPSHVDIRFEEYNYLKFFGPFSEISGQPYRKRKNWFRENGFGYVGDYMQQMNWLGPNATSFFDAPRFPRPYNQINSTNAEDFFNLVSGDRSRPSGQDFVVLRDKSPEISDFQLLHNLDPLVATPTNAGNELDFYDNKNSELNFYFYKNDRSVENTHFYKNSLNLGSGEGFWYSFFRPGSWPGSVNSGEGQGFIENVALGLNRRFQVPLFSEHYNLLAQTVNQCKYADTLPLENFIYWSYSGATFQIRQQRSNLTSLYAVQNYDGPSLGSFLDPLGNTSVSYFDVILFGDNHEKILPADYFLGFNETGVGHGAFFRQFFYELGVPIKNNSSDLGAGMINMSANGNSGHYVTEQCGVKLDLEGITPTRIDTFCGTGTYYEFADVPITESYTRSITGAPTENHYYDYIPQVFSNFNWISFNDWNDKLNELGLHIPIVDVALPVNLEVLNLTTQDSRYKEVPADITFLNAGPSLSFLGVFSGSPTSSADWGEGNLNDSFSFSEDIGQRILIYDGYYVPQGALLQTSINSPGCFDLGIEVTVTTGNPEKMISNSATTIKYQAYITPTDINLLGDGFFRVDSVYTYQDTFIYTFFDSVQNSFTLNGVETPSCSDGTLEYSTNFFSPVTNPSGDYKMYFGFGVNSFETISSTENNIVRTKSNFSLEGYTSEVSPLYLDDKLFIANGTYAAQGASIISETGISLVWGDSEYKAGSILLGRELVYDDDMRRWYNRQVTDIDTLRRYYSEDNYYWRLNAFNLEPAVFAKYSPSGAFTIDKDFPLSNIGNYLYHSDVGVDNYSAFISLAPNVNTLTSQVTTSPFIIEAPSSGLWKASVNSYKTIALP